MENLNTLNTVAEVRDFFHAMQIEVISIENSIHILDIKVKGVRRDFLADLKVFVLDRLPLGTLLILENKLDKAYEDHIKEHPEDTEFIYKLEDDALSHSDIMKYLGKLHKGHEASINDLAWEHED